jgi:hypothetical protein
LAHSNEIKRYVNRVSEILYSSADAKRIFGKSPMNLTLILLDKSICVKISRIRREFHASPGKLFTSGLQTGSPNFWGKLEEEA